MMLPKLVAMLLLVATAAAQDKAVVRFYGESLCPYCKQAVTYFENNVLDTSHAGILDIMDFQYVAWGNAKRDADGQPVCQHGPAECLGNTAEECARNATTQDPVRYMPFVYCLEIEQPEINDTTIQVCAKEAGLDGLDLAFCIVDGRGAAFDTAAEQATPAHPGVPYITLNGKPVDDYTTIVQDVCRVWAGESPAFCAQKMSPYEW